MNNQRTEFIVESREHLAQFERSLLALERASSGEQSRSLIEQSLRAVHSLKGDSGFLGFVTLRNLAHAMESALEDYRDGAHLPSEAVIEVLLLARDQLAVMVEDLDYSQSCDIDALLTRLNQLGRANPRLQRTLLSALSGHPSQRWIIFRRRSQFRNQS